MTAGAGPAGYRRLGRTALRTELSSVIGLSAGTGPTKNRCCLRLHLRLSLLPGGSRGTHHTAKSTVAHHVAHHIHSHHVHHVAHSVAAVAAVAAAAVLSLHHVGECLGSSRFSHCTVAENCGICPLVDPLQICLREGGIHGQGYDLNTAKLRPLCRHLSHNDLGDFFGVSCNL